MTTQPTSQTDTLATGSRPLGERTALADGTVLAGRYRIRELIGEGGMGDVYLATHLKIDKAVAIKVLAPEQMRRPRTVSRFLQEAKAASKIRHENVVDINDYGESDGCAFFVMEYLRGEDLSELVKREGRQPWSRIKPIAIQLLKALSAAHAAGIVHRDIKPHNCFITPREGNPDFVKVIDFGIAKVNDGSEEQLTRTGAIMGTAEYMSPEQGQGEQLDGRSDLYSVGVILYRMLTGAVPFKGQNPMAILYQHIHAARVPPSVACPEAQIGPELDALVLEALAKDRDQRFATAEAFIAAIEAVDERATRSVATVPASPRGWIAIAAIATLMVVAGAVVWWQGRDPAEPAAVAAGAAELETPPAEPAAGADAEPPEPAGDGASTGVEGTTEAPSAAATGALGDTGSSGSGDEPEPAATTTAASEEPGTTLPVRRSARTLRSRLARANAKVRACGKKAGLFPGESVSVQLEIAPSGRVQSAKVMGSFSRKGATCIETVIRGTRFPAAQQSQTFEHRFTL